jgi:hypothetical protein
MSISKESGAITDRTALIGDVFHIRKDLNNPIPFVKLSEKKLEEVESSIIPPVREKVIALNIVMSLSSSYLPYYPLFLETAFINQAIKDSP